MGSEVADERVQRRHVERALLAAGARAQRVEAVVGRLLVGAERRVGPREEDGGRGEDDRFQADRGDHRAERLRH